MFKVQSLRFKVSGPQIIRVYNSRGIKVEEIEVPDESELIDMDATGYRSGLYYLQLISNDQAFDVAKFIKY
jgi:hypothetical protein